MVAGRAADQLAPGSSLTVSRAFIFFLTSCLKFFFPYFLNNESVLKTGHSGEVYLSLMGKLKLIYQNGRLAVLLGANKHRMGKNCLLIEFGKPSI